MSKTREVEEIESKIRAIDQEMAAADKRLERFKQAAADIKEKNKRNLKAMGLASPAELEKLIKDQGIHPDGLNMFKDALAAKGWTMPESLAKLVPTKKETDSGKTAAAPVKKKKRVKIRL
ncbi:MAG: hypothetical protein JEZ12_11520 [Desulfobacterium sp.]|nr:hypothetical protein [Desulfobacterium sp.]